MYKKCMTNIPMVVGVWVCIEVAQGVAIVIALEQEIEAELEQEEIEVVEKVELEQ
jgi:hypothetical protein